MTTNRLSTRGMAASAYWNVGGAVVPAAVGLIVVPHLLALLGLERLGVLSLCWVFIGYFSAFDLGLGRALTREVAVLLDTPRKNEIPDLVWSASILAAIVAMPLGLTIGALATEVIGWMRLPDSVLEVEAWWAIVILAATLPVVLFSTMLSATIEGHHRFDLINAIRVPAGIANFVLPLVAANYWPHLPAVVLALAASRMLQCLALVAVCAVVVPGAIETRRPYFRKLLPLLSFGKWLMVSSVVGPIMEYFDRFVVAGIVGAAIVAYYTLPYDALTKLWMIPIAFSSVLFASVSASRASHTEQIGAAFRAVFTRIATLLVPLLGSCVLFAPELLALWLGEAFSSRSYRVAQVLALGVLVNAFARVPFTYIQAEGRSDWSAKVHLLEIVPYLVLLVFATRAWGILGAACVWVLRIVVDTFIFYRLAAIVRRQLADEVHRQEKLVLQILCSFVTIIVWSPSLHLRMAFACVIATIGLIIISRCSRFRPQ